MFTVHDESLPHFTIQHHAVHPDLHHFTSQHYTVYPDLHHFTVHHNSLIFTLICLISLHNITHYSHLSSSSFCFTKEKKVANFCIQNFSLDTHFFLSFGPIIKQYFGKLGCHPFSPHDFYFKICFSAIFKKIGFLQPHPNWLHKWPVLVAFTHDMRHCICWSFPFTLF